jgi:alpha-glucosidase (family GH31 glycosyl hydrolase)
MLNRLNPSLTIAVALCFIAASCAPETPITTHDEPAQLDIRAAGEKSIRVTLKPISFEEAFPYTPALVEREYPEPAVSIRGLRSAVKRRVGNFQVEIRPDPLTVLVRNSDRDTIQELVFQEDGNLSFETGEHPILGMGEGGPRPERGVEWRELPIEFDRRGRFHNMQPRWQSNAYGSRNPVALLLGTEGWGIFVATPWVQVDLQNEERGLFIPWQPQGDESRPQTQRNQQQNLGKGLPPAHTIVPGLYDLFVFDARDPADLMKDLSEISGPAVMPPKWALGYMQSHRTLEDETQMVDIVNTFREKQIPVDAVIYLGTGFCPRGWNTPQPSFDFNPEVFKREPAEVISDLHDRNVKVIVHIVPWDRDKLPTLHGAIPPAPEETLDESHIYNYWQQHTGLVSAGIDAFWPDEGDWFDLFERIKRHQLYYQGPLSSTPNVRPWSLHRNGHQGIAQWGGWVWSGDTQSAWKTLEAQIAVGINHSLSISPYWGSDIGGFYPNPDKTGEMYARWFQFGAFCPSFRSHGRTWYTALPWGFGLSDMGVREPNNRNDTAAEGAERRSPSPESMNNPYVEPVTRQYAELRYQLMPYTYTLCWEARQTGMPLMRALWLHYPEDEGARGIGDSYLWGRDMLIAPVYEEGATAREVYLPPGKWHDWWTNEILDGGRHITREVDLATMPIYVRAGAIIPFDPVRQYTSQTVNEPTTIRIYEGADGAFTLYEDDGISLEYLDGAYTLTKMSWDDAAQKLVIEPGNDGSPAAATRTFKVELLPQGSVQLVDYQSQRLEVTF